MAALRTAALLLFLLLVPVSSQEVFFTDPVICYFLDAILVVYCIIATAMLFREKFASIPSAARVAGGNGDIYQELERPKDADPYEVLEPSKTKKKAGKKKKSEPTPAEADTEPSQSLILNGSDPPPVSPH